ncbi:carboxymuconolactone decarboxylase family protein [Streptomyces sp. AC495_CC817]|uniref:carboxymuconolactone decarboxylase family protein n=1 Tax=Streptomyces sp. AC495_CC817 TaxID=2823900 RepID=UPI001C2676A0|nr:carboxymuconolactone decarboxylase family protein [Streptomyces sp. AC495_CC817]
MIISTPPVDDVRGHAADMYADDIAEDGFVFGHTRAMAVNPEAHEAFLALIRAIVPSIGVRVYEAATLGAARAIGSGHCLLAHGRKSLRADVVDEKGLSSFAHGDDSGFDDAERAVIRYAEKLSSDPGSMTDADTVALREAGFSDRQIVDITLAAGARNHFSRSLLALAVPLDEVPGLEPSLARSLVEAARAGGERRPTADR